MLFNHPEFSLTALLGLPTRHFFLEPDFLCSLLHHDSKTHTERLHLEALFLHVALECGLEVEELELGLLLSFCLMVVNVFLVVVARSSLRLPQYSLLWIESGDTDQVESLLSWVGSLAQ